MILEVSNKKYIAQRLSSANGLTTISRSILVPCNSKVKLELESDGSITSGAYEDLISFSAFPYNTKFGLVAAWAGYKTVNSGEADPLSFDEWIITKEVTVSDKATVYISMAGYYYVYVSIGTVPLQRSSVTLRKNANVVFTLQRRSTTFTDIDVLGRGIVIQLKQYESLKVMVESGTSISSNADGYHTSFFGFYLGA